MTGMLLAYTMKRYSLQSGTLEASNTFSYVVHKRPAGITIFQSDAIVTAAVN
jgi:hypothetical protein